MHALCGAYHKSLLNALLPRPGPLPAGDRLSLLLIQFWGAHVSPSGGLRGGGANQVPETSFCAAEDGWEGKGAQAGGFGGPGRSTLDSEPREEGSPGRLEPRSQPRPHPREPGPASRPDPGLGVHPAPPEPARDPHLDPLTWQETPPGSRPCPSGGRTPRASASGKAARMARSAGSARSARTSRVLDIAAGSGALGRARAAPPFRAEPQARPPEDPPHRAPPLPQVFPRCPAAPRDRCPRGAVEGRP